MEWIQRIKENGVEVNKTISFSLYHTQVGANLSYAYREDEFFIIDDSVLYRYPAIIQRNGLNNTTGVRIGKTVNNMTPLQSAGFHCINTSRNELLVQLKNGDIGFIKDTTNYTTKMTNLSFFKQFESARDHVGQPILHQHLAFSEITGCWYGFNDNIVYQYYSPKLIDKHIKDIFHLDRHILGVIALPGVSWRALPLYKSNNNIEMFWFSSINSVLTNNVQKWVYCSNRHYGELRVDPEVEIFGSYINGQPMLCSVKRDASKGRLIFDLIPSDLYSYNATAYIDGMQRGQLRSNTKFRSSSTSPNLLLNNAKILRTYDLTYDIKVTLFAY